MGIYILRYDDVDQIRHTATNIWKNFIDNTPKTLKNALEIFMDKLCNGINLEQEIVEITIRAIKEFSSKYGESFYPQIIDVVEKKMKNQRDDIDYMTCFILVFRQIMISIPQPVVARYNDKYIEIVEAYLFTKDIKMQDSLFKFYKVIIEKANQPYLMEQIINKNYQKFQELDE